MYLFAEMVPGVRP